MFSYFSTPAASSRIEHCHELRQIVEQMKNLRDKVAALKLSADKLGAASIAYRKHRVMAALLGEIERQFAVFNGTATVVSDAEILMFVQGMTNSIARFRAAYNPILAWPRDQNREIADASMSAGIYGVSLIAAAALPLANIGTLIAFFYAAPWLCGKARETSGLNNHRTACIRLLEEWQAVLHNLKTNLEMRVPIADRMHAAGSNICPEEYICPISQEIISEPYLCMLDGITYEHHLILQWLREHGTSPHNRVALEADQDPAGVLVLNRNLKTLIDGFKEQHPDFTYAEDVIDGDSEEDRPEAAAAARM